MCASASVQLNIMCWAAFVLIKSWPVVKMHTISAQLSLFNRVEKPAKKSFERTLSWSFDFSSSLSLPFHWFDRKRRYVVSPTNTPTNQPVSARFWLKSVCERDKRKSRLDLLMRMCVEGNAAFPWMCVPRLRSPDNTNPDKRSIVCSPNEIYFLFRGNGMPLLLTRNIS